LRNTHFKKFVERQVQISRVVFYDPFGAEISLSGASATNPGGSNPSGEEPQRVLDSRSLSNYIVILYHPQSVFICFLSRQNKKCLIFVVGGQL
jgi:hypothetical protein